MSTRTVVVTGASGGVGEGIALACAEAGWRVWVLARREAEGRAVAAAVDAAGGTGRYLACDVGDRPSVAQAIDAVVAADGELHGAVHNATSGRSSLPIPMLDLTPAELADHARVSVDGLVHLAQACLPHLEATGGALVALTSEAAFEGKLRLSAYAAVKAAERGLARTLAREWGPQGVRVNCIAPLASSPAMVDAFERDPTMAARVLGRIPVGRLGDARADIGPVVRFLLGDDARYVTGQTLMVDGGSCAIA